MMLSFVTIVVFLLAKYVKAQDFSDYVEKCIDHPEDDNEQMEKFDLIDDAPEFWDMYCDDSEEDCPSDWICDPTYKICYAPSFVPSYFKDLAAADPRKIVNFKQGKVKCASSDCQCIEGYRCEKDKCLVRPEFAANAVNATEASAVGGISTIKFTQSLVKNNEACVCVDKKTRNCYEARCIRSRRRGIGNRCFCDYKWYTRKQQRKRG